MEPYLTLPNTDLKLSRLILGTANAGLRWDGEEALRLFDTYVDMGGNAIDTARVYSDWVPPEIGRSERVIGDWLQHSGKRDKMILITKGGHPTLHNMTPRMTPGDMRYDLELSLKTLRTDRIDIYFYHRDDPRQSIAEEIETMETFRTEGKIRYYGCSNWDAHRIMEADKYCAEKGYRGFVADQALLNIGSSHMNPMPDSTLRSIKGPLFQYHLQNSQNLAMPYTGIAGGFFHRFASQGAETVKDSPYYTPENTKIAKRCVELTEKYNATITQVLLGFFAFQPFACAPLFGPSKASQIPDAMQTFQIPFIKEDFIVD